jgi:hypothetical protein
MMKLRFPNLHDCDDIRSRTDDLFGEDVYFIRLIDDVQIIARTREF